MQRRGAESLQEPEQMNGAVNGEQEGDRDAHGAWLRASAAPLKCR